MPLSVMWRVAIAVLALGAGCSARPPLTDLQNGSLLVNLSPETVSVFVDPAESEGKTCRKLPTLALATFNGLPLKRMTGMYAAGDLTYDRDCLLEFGFPGTEFRETTVGRVELGGPIPAPARSTGAVHIRIGDANVVWSLAIPDAFTPRTLTLVSSPGGRVLHRGDQVVLRWSPATDWLNDRGIGIGLNHPEHPLDGVTIRRSEITVVGDRLTFAIPTDVPDKLNGPVNLRFLGTALVKPKMGPCPVRSCTLSLSFSMEPVTATLVP